MKTVLILEATAGGGHISITDAIIEALLKLSKKNGVCEITRANLSPEFGDKFYRFTSRNYVKLWQLLFKATDNEKVVDIPAKIFQIANQGEILKLINHYQPNIILSQSPIATPAIAKFLESNKLSIPHLIFVPDPFSVHAVYLTNQATLTLVATLSAYHIAIAKRLNPNKVKITGHPVREAFYQIPKNLNQHRQNFHLNPQQFTILFGGSGDGAEKILETFRYLNTISEDEIKPFQAIFVTGTNTKLKSQLEQLKFPPHITPLILGKVDNMSDYVHAADLVIGKAGPNIIFESVAARKPFLATYHIKGQEDGNLDFIRSTQIGFVEENPKQAAKLIQTILENPKILDFTQPGIDYVRTQHKNAAQNIAKIILNQLGQA